MRLFWILSLIGPFTVAVLLPVGLARADLTWAEIAAEDDWTTTATRQHDDAGTVTVLRATIDGVQCFQGQATVDVEPRYLLEVAMDIDGTPQWASTADVTEAATLLRKGDVLDYYQMMDVPGWTLSRDRFWFLRGTSRRDGGTLSFTWEKLDEGGSHSTTYQEFVTEHSKAIEPPINAGGWVFTPGAAGTAIRYHICTDAGGEIPQKLQAFATSSTLPDTVGDLVREARKRAR